MVKTTAKTSLKIYNNSEYESLQEVLLCSPRYMKIRDVINETQKHYADENIDTNIACEQHSRFLQTLQDKGIKTYLLEPKPQLPEQVFTRDIGFAIHDKLFISTLKQEVRKEEREIFKQWTEEHRLQTIECMNHIEGGDVIVDGRDIWVGLGSRTSSLAATELRSYLPNHRIHALHFDPSYLHLDCVFQPISSKDALIFPSAFPQKEKDLLYSKFNPIEVDSDEQFTLGTNVLSIGNQIVISLPDNIKVNRKLEQNGYHVIQVNISEIIKSGGSFRCMTLPLSRHDSMMSGSSPY